MCICGEFDLGGGTLQQLAHSPSICLNCTDLFIKILYCSYKLSSAGPAAVPGTVTTAVELMFFSCWKAALVHYHPFVFISCTNH